MRTALFATCLVDQVWPTVGLCAARLLEDAGCEVLVDAGQTCCGQPACNSGFVRPGLELARHTIAMFERTRAEALVCPSGSCAAQIRHYPRLFAADAAWQSRAAHMAERTFELAAFLVEQVRLQRAPGRFRGRVGYSDSCHGLRELGVRDQPRQLLRLLPELELRELPHADACCGFGGTFAVKFPEISVAIADRKLDAVLDGGVDALVGGDVSCLLHLRSRLQQRQCDLPVLHFAELLCHGVDP